MAITRPDKFTWGCVNTALALRNAGAPFELHIYPDGGHSGLFNKYPLMEFAREASRFLKDKGIFTEAMQKAGDNWLDSQIPVTKAALFPDAAKMPKPKAARGKAIKGIKESQLTIGEKDILKIAGDKPVLRLWPDNGYRDDDPLEQGAEELASTKGGNLRINQVTVPSMTVFRPAKTDGRSVLIFPGGAYNTLAIEHEGIEIAGWLNSMSVTAFIVKYRVPRREGLGPHAVALQDAHRAIRLVRSQADLFGIDPEKIGVLGFSAGGNLAALACHQFALKTYEPIDAHDKVSTKPNFGVLVYPAYTTLDKTSSKVNPLLASQSKKDIVPLFIAFAADDPHMPGVLHYFLALRKSGVPAECHIFEAGGHGKGLRKEGYPFSQWPEACRRWLTDLETINAK
jgi:acetyl esterase/lipase